jgi:creatinine amidohydrolase
MRGIASFSAIALSVLFAGGALQRPPAVQDKGIRLAEITWQQAADVLRPETVVLIPLGAGSKEHGPHLKLGNDAALAEYLTNRVLKAADVVVAPSLPYHYYPAFTEYPGSTSLTLETARALTTEAALGLSRFGPRRFYVLNTGVSTARALEPAARALASQGVLLGYTDLASRLDRAAAGIRQQEGGTHADEVETSMMLYIDAASVDMRRAVREYTPASGALHLTRRRGAPGTFSESGVWGDPTLATREKGRVIVESLVSSIVEDIDSLRRATPPAPTTSSQAGPPSRTELSAARPEGTRPGSCTPGDERTVRSIGDALTLHWRNADAAQLAALWAADGDIVHPDGLTERGRETIRANRAALFLRREYRGSAHPVTLGPIRCPSAGIAVADGKWEMRGVTDTTGTALPTFEGLLTLVLSRGLEGWTIEAYRYTQKPASAPLPTWLKRPGYPGGAQ